MSSEIEDFRRGFPLGSLLLTPEHTSLLLLSDPFSPPGPFSVEDSLLTTPSSHLWGLPLYWASDLSTILTSSDRMLRTETLSALRSVAEAGPLARSLAHAGGPALTTSSLAFDATSVLRLADLDDSLATLALALVRALPAWMAYTALTSPELLALSESELDTLSTLASESDLSACGVPGARWPALLDMARLL